MDTEGKSLRLAGLEGWPRPVVTLGIVYAEHRKQMSPTQCCPGIYPRHAPGRLEPADDVRALPSICNEQHYQHEERPGQSQPPGREGFHRVACGGIKSLSQCSHPRSYSAAFGGVDLGEAGRTPDHYSVPARRNERVGISKEDSVDNVPVSAKGAH